MEILIMNNQTRDNNPHNEDRRSRPRFQEDRRTQEWYDRQDSQDRYRSPGRERPRAYRNSNRNWDRDEYDFEPRRPRTFQNSNRQGRYQRDNSRRRYPNRRNDGYRPNEDYRRNENYRRNEDYRRNDGYSRNDGDSQEDSRGREDTEWNNGNRGMIRDNPSRVDWQTHGIEYRSVSKNGQDSPSPRT